MNLSTLLLDHPFADDEPLLHDIRRSWTAGQARARVRDLAAKLSEIGVERRGVAVRLERGAEVVLAMTAIWAAGGVFIPINPRLPDLALMELLNDLAPAAIIDANGTRSTTTAPTHYDDGVAFLLWTSGTTGKPKPVMHTHDAYIEIIDRILEPLRGADRATDTPSAKPPSPNLIPVSMALNAGIYNALFGLRAGAPVVLMDRFTTDTFATLVQRHQIRSTILAPAAMAMLSDDEAITDLSPLRFVRSVTAPLSAFQARRFMKRFGVTVLNGYGQVELGEVIGWTAADAKQHPERLGAAGKPHPGVLARIADPDTNGVGELLIRPPVTFDEATRAAFGDRLTHDGFVRTGDLAHIDDAGFVWIEGRIGDLINRGGNKIVPDEVEEVLVALPQVREVAVVGLPDDRLGQVPVAFIVVTAPIDDGELEAACRTSLVPYKVPIRFERVEALPRSEIGKVLRRDLMGNR
jgi:long-chain acyl-CoA synthetase